MESMDFIKIVIEDQRLYFFRDGRQIRSYPISTSRYGVGNKSGSNKTPLGDHIVHSKIGKDAPSGMIFVKRRKTGKVASIHRKEDSVLSDLITSRIVRLKGLEDGLNKGDGVDSYKRCIYIHGTSEEWLIGKPASHGCIRMKNKHIVELFDLVKRGTVVQINR